MKNKSFLLLSVILIAFVVVTSYTPNAVQAETPKQVELVSGTQSGKGEILMPFQSYSAVGINFAPHHSDVTYYNAGFGCLGSTYNGPTPITFSYPINVHDKSFVMIVDMVYYNFVQEPAEHIEVTVFRRKVDSIETEVLKTETLDYNGLGAKNAPIVLNKIFHTIDWIYWLEFKLPPGNETAFCSMSVVYDYSIQLPPLFPLAFPSVITKP